MGPFALSSMTPALLEYGKSAIKSNVAAGLLPISGDDGRADDERGDKLVEGREGEMGGDGGWDAGEEEGFGVVGQVDRNEGEEEGFGVDGKGDRDEEDADDGERVEDMGGAAKTFGAG